jgi:hypothetical protein
MVCASVFAFAACGAEQQPDEDRPLTFEEFEGLTYQEPGTEVYIYNGDEVAENLDQLRLAYDRYLESWDVMRGFETLDKGLAVNRVGGADDRWSSTVA